MVDRISTSGRYDRLMADVQQSLFNYNKITQQLASGNKLTSITDDPIAAVNIINTNRQLGQIDTFSQNVELAMSELSTLDDLMQLATGYLSQAWDKAVQANNQTYGEDSLKALKVEIDEIIKTMVDLANTEYNNNYIFGGANTKIMPYTLDENGNIIYNGTTYDNPDYIRQTEVSDGVFEVINTTGDKVFGYYEAVQEQTADGKNVFLDADGNRVIETVEADGSKTYALEDGTAYAGNVDDLEISVAEEKYSGIMGTLKLLSNSIQMVLDGDTEAGYEQMNATLDMFESSMNTITTEQTKFGGVYNRLEMTTSTLETNNTNLTSYLSELNDIDIATAVTEWMQAQYAYQASLQVTSASMGMSLLNYL